VPDTFWHHGLVTYEIRRATDSDTTALYRICLRTAADGGDARSLYADPDLLGHFYVGPYVQLEPELAFVVADETGAVGYIVGTADTRRFAAECEQRWFPRLRRRYPRPGAHATSADAQVIQLLHRGIDVSSATPAHPAHLHIDLEPAAQGKGWGRQLLERFEDELRDRGVPGLHLTVSATNSGAIAFYERLDLERRRGDAGSVVYVRSLPTTTC
jgi:ribosomal protein S18 acetylase RimI-like enzyme